MHRVYVCLLLRRQVGFWHLAV